MCLCNAGLVTSSKYNVAFLSQTIMRASRTVKLSQAIKFFALVITALTNPPHSLRSSTAITGALSVLKQMPKQGSAYMRSIESPSRPATSSATMAKANYNYIARPKQSLITVATLSLFPSLGRWTPQ